MCDQARQDRDFEFLLHEFDSAQEDVKQISERRYNLIKFYAWLIIGIISAIGFIFKDFGGSKCLNLVFSLWAIVIGVVFLVFLGKEQKSVNRCLNKINLIRKNMDIRMPLETPPNINDWDNARKRGIYLDTEPLDGRGLNDDKFWGWFTITRVMVIVIFLASLCFMGLIILSFSSGFFRLLVLWRELILFGLLLILFIMLFVASWFSIK